MNDTIKAAKWVQPVGELAIAAQAAKDERDRRAQYAADLVRARDARVADALARLGRAVKRGEPAVLIARFADDAARAGAGADVNEINDAQDAALKGGV